MALIPILWAWSAGVSRADPVALRPLDPPGQHAVFALSTRSLSVAMAGSPPAGLRLGLDVGMDGEVFELAAGIGRLRAGQRGLGVEGGFAAGVAVLPLARNAALTFTPFAGAGYYGRSAAVALRLVAPAALGPTGLRLPLLAELVGAVGSDRLRLGPRLAAGPVWTVGLDVSLAVEAGLLFTIGGWSPVPEDPPG